jgi:hypothetical protein
MIRLPHPESLSGAWAPSWAELCFPWNNKGPSMMGWQPCSSHPRKLTILCKAEAWVVYSPMGQTGCFPHQLSHCTALSPLVCICYCSSYPSLCHRLGRNCPCWLVSGWKVFICSLLSLLGRMHIYYLLLLMWFPFVAPEPSSCDLCMCTTQAGIVVTRTLLFHTHYCCAGSIIRPCTHNHTTYLVCSHGNQHICFNPTYCPQSNG